MTSKTTMRTIDNRKYAADFLPTVVGLKWNRENRTHDDFLVSPTVYYDENQNLCITLEDGNGYYFGDYYGEFRGGFPWICNELENWAAENGGYWEWCNPGAIMFVK